MSESPYYPYPPRPGTRTESISVDAIANKTLNPSEREAVITFEQNLYALTLDAVDFPSAEAYRAQKESEGMSVEPFESIWKKKVNSIEIGVDYFHTPEGKQTWKTVTGNDLTSDTPAAYIKELSSQALQSISADKLDQLEAESLGYTESTLTKQFIQGGYQADALANPDIISLYKNPETLVEKMRGYRTLKEYLLQAKKDLLAQATPNSALIEGELLIIDLYRKRINYFLADGYTTAYKILKQYQLSDTQAHSQIITELEEILPAFKNNDDTFRNAQFLQRLDRYKNGVSQDDEGNYTWKSPEAKNLMTRAASAGLQDSPSVDRGAYGDIDTNDLKTTKISGETFGDWVKSVLEDYELLSTHEEWNSEREGPAPDEKWQVIVNDKFKSLAVNDKQRIVKVPVKEVALLSALPLINHELFHVIQHTNKRALGSLAIMQSIGLDNVSEQTEAGGKWQEKVAKQMLTGAENLAVPGTGYFKALEVKERGGTFGEVIQAYYEDLRDNTTLSAELAAAQSVNRARRIFRAGGFQYAQNNNFITNTQPLSYLEQQLIYESLDDTQRKVLAVGGVTIRNLIRLSEAGLVDTNNISLPPRAPVDLLYAKVKDLTTPHSTTKVK